MKPILLLAALAVTACSRNPTAPLEADHTCDQVKLDFLHQHFGAAYTPTDELMGQSQFNLGGNSKAVFAVVNGQCTVTVS